MPDILVVDDHPVNIQLMRSQLAVLGRQCDIASDPAQALALWEQGSYRLVITDCHMPGLDGMQLTRQIREIETGRKARSAVSILAWTADAQPDNLQRCREAGMNGHLIKPTLLDALREAIDSLLGAPVRGADNAPALRTATEPEAAPPILDEHALLEFSGGVPAAEDEILAQFLDVNERDMRTLLEAVGARDAAKLRLIAHRIKGACRIISAGPLGGTLERLEAAARLGDWPSILADLAAVKTEQARLVAHFQERLRRNSPGSQFR